MVIDKELYIYRFSYTDPVSGRETVYRYVENKRENHSMADWISKKEAMQECRLEEMRAGECVSRQLHGCLPEEFPDPRRAFDMFMGQSVKTNSLIIHIPDYAHFDYGMARELRDAIDLVGEIPVYPEYRENMYWYSMI